MKAPRRVVRFIEKDSGRGRAKVGRERGWGVGVRWLRGGGRYFCAMKAAGGCSRGRGACVEGPERLVPDRGRVGGGGFALTY